MAQLLYFGNKKRVALRCCRTEGHAGLLQDRTGRAWGKTGEGTAEEGLQRLLAQVSHVLSSAIKCFGYMLSSFIYCFP